jgi:uncharacterized protein (TIGR00369 family)
MTTKLTPLSHGALNRCFGCGQKNRTGLRLKFFVDDEQQIVCRLRVPRRFEGPPGHVHGGVIATLLDEAMSKANRQLGVVAMTRQMEVEYLKPVPLMTPLTLTAHHLSANGRAHRCEAKITDASSAVLARGKALFIAVDPAMLLKSAPESQKPPL